MNTFPNATKAIDALVKVTIALASIVTPHLPKIILTLGVAACMMIVAFQRPEAIPDIIPEVFKQLAHIIK